MKLVIASSPAAAWSELTIGERRQRLMGSMGSGTKVEVGEEGKDFWTLFQSLPRLVSKMMVGQISDFLYQIPFVHFMYKHTMGHLKY